MTEPGAMRGSRESDDARERCAERLDVWIHPRQVMFRTVEALEEFLASLERAAKVEAERDRLREQVRRVRALFDSPFPMVTYAELRHALDGTDVSGPIPPGAGPKIPSNPPLAATRALDGTEAASHG